MAQAKKARKGFMGGVDIRANVPTYRFPCEFNIVFIISFFAGAVLIIIICVLDIYKRDEEGEGLASIDGPEYYDNSIPWAGAYIDLVNGITEVR